MRLFFFFLEEKGITRTMTWNGKPRLAKHHQPGQDTGRTARHRIRVKHTREIDTAESEERRKESRQPSQTRPRGDTLRRTKGPSGRHATGRRHRTFVQLFNDLEGNQEDTLEGMVQKRPGEDTLITTRGPSGRHANGRHKANLNNNTPKGH